jgi:imidazole glycerol phosphate synthase subunit HisF
MTGSLERVREHIQEGAGQLVVTKFNPDGTSSGVINEIIDG